MEPGSKPQLERRKICFSFSLLPLLSYLQLVPIGSGWDASLRYEAPHLWRYSKRGQAFTQMGQPVKVIPVFPYTGDTCLYSFTFYPVFLVFFSTRFLFTHFEFAHYFFFFDNNWMPYSRILATSLLQLRSLRL